VRTAGSPGAIACALAIAEPAALLPAIARTAAGPIVASARRALALRRTIAFRSFPPKFLREAAALFVAGHLESLAWILVLAAWTPRGPALFAHRGPFALQRFALMFRRFPQPAACKPHHPCVRMPRLQLPKRGRELLLRARAKRRRLILENDGPVGEAGRHK
jgi:hypothetical protein